VRNPHDFKLHQLINIGALYPARPTDTLASLAYRFRTTAETLMVPPPLPPAPRAVTAHTKPLATLTPSPPPLPPSLSSPIRVPIPYPRA
jgi:hypothetical protein